MKNKVDLSIDFAGIKLANPVLTASGTCGYANELGEFMNIDKLGGFITKSISVKPRKGNPTPRMVETDSGMLNAIGLANIGLDRFIQEKLPLLNKMKAAIFVNIAGTTIDDYIEVTEKLADQNTIAGFELNISCPKVKKAARDKKLIVKLTPTVTNISETASAAVQSGADALSLVNTFTAMVIDIETKKPILANRTGGLSGPAIKPMAVYLVNKVYNEVTKNTNTPILGLGGITTASDAIEFMIAGATAISVGTASFFEPRTCEKNVDGIEKFCAEKKISSVAELTGSLV